METKISASLLACDLSDIASEVARCEAAGVDLIHYDVMDGRFVEQITYGAPVLKCLKRRTALPVDVHLMIEDPAPQLEYFAEAGAANITIHAESSCDVRGCLERIRALGVKASVAVKPGTPLERIYGLLGLCDMVLVMTVEPGYGGQELIKEMLSKIGTLRSYADAHGFSALNIEADGGINAVTARTVAGSGANVLVAGTALFRAEDMRGLCAAMKG